MGRHSPAAAVAVSSQSQIQFLSPIYFMALTSLSNLYAAIDTLSGRPQAQVMGLRNRSFEAGFVRKSHMPQIEPLEPPDSCEPPLRFSSKSLFFIGMDRRGNWVARDQAGLCGGLFVNRSEAVRFAMRENGRHSRAVIMVPGILELTADFWSLGLGAGRHQVRGVRAAAHC
jgi:hypothetical protein